MRRHLSRLSGKSFCASADASTSAGEAKRTSSSPERASSMWPCTIFEDGVASEDHRRNPFSSRCRRAPRRP